MEEKNAKIYLITVIILAIAILSAVWFGTPEEPDTLNVTLSPGETPGIVQLNNVQDSYQYSLDNGLTWVNITQDGSIEIPAEAGDTLLIRDIDPAQDRAQRPPNNAESDLNRPGKSSGGGYTDHR